MIDVHCHLEQKDYDKDRDRIIQKCRQELRALVTSCVHPSSFDLTMKLIEKYRNFVFCTCSVHPIHIKEISGEEKANFFNLIRENRDKIVAIGETGLDYHWVKEKEWREKQKQLFREMIGLAKELEKPLVIHSWESDEDCIEILEQEGSERVNWHMFGGRALLERVLSNQWSISMNAIVLKSKDRKKIIRDMPLDRIMLETDAPWLDPEGGRNTPLVIKRVARKIAEIKKIPYEQIWETCGRNALQFFHLPITL
ncbi:MAG: TatD family hydrolase [archaeon]|nr:MAG: TatD family hydrolase [archaeon]